MNAELQSSVRTLLGVEADLHNTSRALRKAAHVGPMDYVAEADEAQALASLVYGLRHRIEVHAGGDALRSASATPWQSRVEAYLFCLTLVFVLLLLYTVASAILTAKP